MAGVEWSPELARDAREWAQRLRDERGCGLEHRPRSGAFARRHGENLYWASALRWSNGATEPQEVTPAQVVESWYSEKQHYDHASNSCARGKVCGHYTQVVWADSKRIGCARASCQDDSQVLVCNYDPPGNYIGRKPF